MSITDFLQSAGGSKQFISEIKFEEILAKQNILVPEVLETIRQLEESPSEELRLEFFFYTNTATKAKEFSDFLKLKNYSVEYSKSIAGINLFEISGWTTKISIEEKNVLRWAKEMCEFGFQFDCEFYNWGTTPDQE